MDRSTIRVLSLLQLVMLVASQSAAPPPVMPPPSFGPSLAPVIPIPMAPKIDTHCHYAPPFYRQLLNSRNITSGGRSIPNWNATAHLAFMAQFNIITSIVAVSTPGVKLSIDAPVEEGRTLARQVNEFGYNLTEQYPKKFLFWATLTLPDLEGAVAEAIYALDTLGAAGVVIEASVFGELLGTPRWAPLYEVLNARKAVVFVHPSNSPCAEEPIYTPASTDIPSFVIDFLLDTSRAAVNLVYRNVTVTYPDITFILAHSGGFLPFAGSRAAGGLALLAGSSQNVNAYLAKLRKFHVDLAISATQFSLPSTTTFFNTTQMTYGSDYPYATVGSVQSNTAAIEAFRFGRAARRRIGYSNAYQLFKKVLLN